MKKLVFLGIVIILFSCATSQIENKDNLFVKSPAGGSSLVILDDFSDSSNSAANFNTPKDNTADNSSFDNIQGSSGLTADQLLSCNTSGFGITSNLNVTVKNNIILIKPVNGILDFGQGNIEILKFANGSWNFKDNIQLKLINNGNEALTGRIDIDQVNGIVSFAPDKKLVPNDRYDLFIADKIKNFEVIILIAVDYLKDNNSFFNSICNKDAGVYNVKDLINNNRAVYCWSFINNPYKIMSSFTNVEKDAEVYLTLYASYNNSHNNEIYYQRWINTGNIIENYLLKSKSDKNDSVGKIIFDDEDSSVDGFSGYPDYSFANIYLEIKIFQNGKDITSLSNAKLNIVNYYSYMKILKFRERQY